MSTQTLSGTISTGYTLSTYYSGLVVTAAASVTGAVGADQTGVADGGKGGAGVNLTSTATLSNAGTIIGGAGGYGYHGGGGGAGVYLASGGSVYNTGLVSGGAGGYGAHGAGLGGAGLYAILGAAIANSGSIVGGDGAAGVQLVMGGGVSNAGGAVVAGYVGIYAGPAGAATVTNYGSILGTGGTSIRFASSGDRLIAEAGSTLLGTAQGGGGTLELAAATGTITGLGGAGTVSGAEDLTFSGFASYVLDPGGSWTLAGANALASAQTLTDGGSLTVAGSLSNTRGAGVQLAQGGALTNDSAGTIGGVVGVYALGGAATVTTYGSIEGTGGTSVLFASSGDRLIVEAGSTFLGKAQGGGGTLEVAAATGTIAGLGATGTILGAQGLTFAGFASYVLDAGGSWTLAGSSALAAGDTLVNHAMLTVAGSLANAGALVGLGGGALRLAGGVAVTNGGPGATAALISGYFDGLFAQSGKSVSVTNFGAIVGTYRDGVYLTSGGVVTNGAATSTAARIWGAYAGVYSLSHATTVTNWGTITGPNSEGVQLTLGGVVTNGGVAAPAALISGYFDGVYAGGAATVTNFGSIVGTNLAGVLLAAGGGVTNASMAAISGWEFGVYAFGAATTVINGGTIQGAYGEGVDMLAGGAVVNGGATSTGALITGLVGLYAGARGVTVNNFGAIVGTGGTALWFKASGDRLIDEVGSTLIGTALGGGGVLELAGALGGSITGLGTSFTGFASYSLDAGGFWTLTGANSLAKAHTLSNLGTLCLAGSLANAGAITGDGVTLAAGGQLSNGAVTGSSAIITGAVGVYAGPTGAATVINFGVIQGTGGISVQFSAAQDRLIAQAGSTFVGAVQGGGGTLELAGGTGTITGFGAAGTLSGAEAMSFAGFAALAIDAGGRWAMTGANSLASGVGLTIAGSLTIRGAVTNSGTIAVVSGAALTLDNADLIGGTLQSAVAVTIVGTGNSLDGTAGTFDNQATLTLAANAALTLQGSIVNAGKLALTSARSITIVRQGAPAPSATRLLVGAAGATLGGGGSVSLGSGALDEITGVAANVTLTNFDNTISGSGLIGAGGMGLTNLAAGVIDQTGGVALIIDTGTATIANAGIIEASGTGGALIASAVANTGLLEAIGGNLTVDGAVTGTTGSAIINRGTLYFASSVSQNIRFSGATGELVLAQSLAYAGSIAGISQTGGTLLDLRDIALLAATQATYSGDRTGGILTVTDGTHTALLDIAGNYQGSTWTVSGDGVGGVIVIDSQARASAPAFVAAMAAVGAAPPSAQPIALRQAAQSLATLASPTG